MHRALEEYSAEPRDVPFGIRAATNGVYRTEVREWTCIAHWSMLMRTPLLHSSSPNAANIATLNEAMAAVVVTDDSSEVSEGRKRRSHGREFVVFQGSSIAQAG